MEDQTVHIVSEVGQRDLGLGALDADGSDEQAHFVLLMRKDVLDASAHLGFDCVGLGCSLRHWPAAGLLAVDPADLALPFDTMSH